MDTYAGSEGQPRLDILGFGQPHVERLQPLLGHADRRHSRHADQLVDILLQELGGHALLAGAQYGRLAELARQDHSRDSAHHIVQRGQLQPIQAPRGGGQDALVREDQDELFGQDDQYGQYIRIGDILQGDAQKDEERHPAQHSRVDQPYAVQLRECQSVVQLHRALVLQESRPAVERADA